MYNSWCSVCQGQKCHILMDWTVDMLDVCNAGNESSINCVCIATYLHFYVFVIAFSCICICIFMYLYSLLSALQRAFSSWRQPISLRGARQNEESKAKNNWSRKKSLETIFFFSSSLPHTPFEADQPNHTNQFSFWTFSTAHFLLLSCTFSMIMRALVNQRCCSASLSKSSRFVKHNWKLHSVGPFAFDFQSLTRWRGQLF